MVRELTPRRSRSRFCGHHPQVPLAEGPGDLRITGAFCRVRVRARRVLPSQPDASCAFPSRDRRCGGLFLYRLTLTQTSPRPHDARPTTRRLVIPPHPDMAGPALPAWGKAREQMGSHCGCFLPHHHVLVDVQETGRPLHRILAPVTVPPQDHCISHTRAAWFCSVRSTPYPSGLLSVPEAPSPRPFRGHDEGPEDAPMRMLLVRDVTEAELDAEI